MTQRCLERTGKPALAYNYTPASGEGADLPAIMFLGGYRSDKEGTKALFLEQECTKRGQAFIRFDYSAHGASEGNFMEGTIGDWKDDALAILEHIVKEEKVILVGSSMGGWIALLIGQERPQRVAGIVGIAAAPDFTRRFYNEELSDEQRRIMDAQGFIAIPNDYSEEPYIFTRALIEDGEKHCLLDRDNSYDAPIILLQGMKDEDVPWQTAHRIRNAIGKGDVEVFLIEHGDHRLSQPADLEKIGNAVKTLCGL